MFLGPCCPFALVIAKAFPDASLFEFVSAVFTICDGMLFLRHVDILHRCDSLTTPFCYFGLFSCAGCLGQRQSGLCGGFRGILASFHTMPPQPSHVRGSLWVKWSGFCGSTL